MSPPGLDFLVIGAPKAGTTSLHEYMRTHPGLLLPEAKEQQFFTRDSVYEEGWAAFAAIAFRGDIRGRRVGKVTPFYLGGPAIWEDPGAATPENSVAAVTAARIATTFPQVRLIVMLRDPVERAISSYWQAVALGDETRSIDQAFEVELATDALDAARAYPASNTAHVVLGEYGRLLGAYLEHFARDQLFVGSTATLASEPERLLGEVWRYLGVDPHRPPNLGQRYQVRGTGRRSRVLSAGPRVVREVPGLRHAWNILPRRAKDALRSRTRAFAHRQEARSFRPHAELEGEPRPELLARLRAHYEPDLARLEELVGPVPGVTVH
jgi:hypothetical protein